MIELKHLSKTFQMKDGAVQALRDINLTIPDGMIYGIIGMSGAGKSTLVRCINLLERPTEGQVVIDGTEMQSLTPAQLRQRRQKIAMIFQHFNLLMQRTVLDNVCFSLEILGTKKKEARQKARELLKIVELEEKPLENFFGRTIISYSAFDQIFIIILSSFQMDQASGIFPLPFQFLQALGQSKISRKNTLIHKFFLHFYESICLISGDPFLFRELLDLLPEHRREIIVFP